MKRVPKRSLTTWDTAILVLFAILTAMLFARAFLPIAPADRFTVTTADETSTYPLHRDAKILVESNGISLHITCTGGAVCVKQASCPDGTCAASGTISRPGETIVCVPGKTIIEILGEEASDHADLVIG